MSDVVIDVKNLSKRYRIGTSDKRSNTFAGQLASIALAPLNNFRQLTRMTKFSDDDNTVFWALRDLNFCVKQGEVLGIIGKNGAGKSTLLKILSRITEPTMGEIIIKGRVSSLLEVGTGFHPELTGRENVYMNGTILGMRRREIDLKFDEIVEFSGIEKFIDTPVKFYSSGMKVRLGFAVAAHLDPEVLIVDEVLAVGDVEFQTKCLGKMNEVSKNEGRTVLFVSHNMGTMKSLCSSGLFLSSGRIAYAANDISDVITKYYETTNLAESVIELKDRTDRAGDGRVRIETLSLNDSPDNSQLELGQTISFSFSYSASMNFFSAKVLLSVNTFNGECILFLDSSVIKEFPTSLNRSGEIDIVLSDDFALPLGRYYVNIAFMVDGVMADHIQKALIINVVDGLFFSTGKVPFVKSLVYVKHNWTYKEL